jgi:twitching motility protein PilT
MPANKLILLTGTTGSGKSSTLAAMIHHVNQQLAGKIVTIEDPIEFLHNDIRSNVIQREIGIDTISFEAALRAALRQDPDIILVGEMRDRATIDIALKAAETGHMVLSTLHAGTADMAIPRMLDVFPPDEQDQIRMALAANLYGVVCQRLVPDIQGGAIPAVEIMINTSTVRKLLEKNQLEVIGAAIETGEEDGMITFNKCVYNLIKKGIITEKEGMTYCTNPESLRMNLQGIFLDEGKRILGG